MIKAKTPSLKKLRPGSVIAEFVLGTFVQQGATVEEIDWGIYDVLGPEGDLRRLTFDVEVAQDRLDCELVSIGTPLFEEIQQVSRQQGKTLVRWVPMPDIKVPGSLSEKVAKLIHFVKCRPPQVVSWTVEEGSAVLFRFHVVYQMAELVEEIVSVLIDCGLLADITSLLPSLEAQWFAVDPATDLAQDTKQPSLRRLQPLHSLAESYQQAAKVVSRQINQRIDELQREYHVQQQEEQDQSDRYYQTTLMTLRQQLQNAVDASRVQRLKEKIIATQTDWDRRREDIARSYNIVAEVSLDQSVLYLAPVVSIEATVQQRTDRWPFLLFYYPWARTWAPVVCPSCNTPVTKLGHDNEGWHCGCRE